MLTFERLRNVNVERCQEAFHPLVAWSLSDWACAMAGEAGEACNVVKKYRRYQDGTNTAKDPQTVDEIRDALAAELADTIIYADLLAARAGIDLGEAVRAKFNAVSELRNVPHRL